MANKEQTDQIRKLEENFYEYGLPNDEDMSFFGQMVNMVTPARRTVLREPQTTFSDPTYAPDPMTGELRGEVERSVTPGLYGEPEFGMSYMPIARAPGKALDYLSSFITEPETRSAALEGIQSLPEAITRRMRVSEEAAQGGMSEVYDPSTGDVVSSGDMLLAAPLLGAPGTALSIAQMGDKGSSALFGNFGGTRGRFGPEAEQIIARLEAQGITDPAQQWEAQANTNLPFRAFRDDLGGNIKYEIPTKNTKLAPINGKELDEEFLDDALFSLGSNNPSEIYDRRGAFYLEPSSLGGDRPDNIKLPSSKSFKFSGETKANAYGLTFRNTRVGDKTPDYAIRKAEENGIVIPTTLQPVPLPTIDQVLDFPELFEEYPVLREMRVTDVPGIFNIGLSGAYDDKNNILMLASQPNTPEGRQQLASVALHEIQHGLQTIEGFPRGGSSSAYYPKGYEEKRNELREDDKKLKEKIQTRMEEWDERLFGRDLEAAPELSLTDRSNVQLINNYIRHATEEQTREEGSYLRGHYLKLKNNSIQELDQKLQLGPNLLPMFIENLDDFVQESAKLKERQSKVYKMETEGFKSYAGLPGEVEARNVQLRFEGDKKKTAAEYRDMTPTQTRDNQGLFFPLEESDLYKKAEGGEISNMSERKAGLADLIYKKHFSSGPLSRMQPQSFRRGGPALGGGPINRPRFNNFEEEEQYVNPAVSSYVNQLPEPLAQAIASEASGVQYTDEARFLPNQNEPIGSLGIKTSGSFMGPGDDFEDRQRAGTGIIQQQVQNNQQPVGGRTFDAEPTPETAAETLINQTNTVVADPVVADPVVADPVVADPVAADPVAAPASVSRTINGPPTEAQIALAYQLFVENGDRTMLNDIAAYNEEMNYIAETSANNVANVDPAGKIVVADPVVTDPVVADPVTQGTPIDEVLPAGNSFGSPAPDPSTLPSLDSYDPNEVGFVRGILGHMGSQYDDRQLLEILNNQFGDGRTVSSDTMDLLFFRPEGEVGILQALDSSEFGTYPDYLNRIQAEQEAAAAAAANPVVADPVVVDNTELNVQPDGTILPGSNVDVVTNGTPVDQQLPPGGEVSNPAVLTPGEGLPADYNYSEDPRFQLRPFGEGQSGQLPLDFYQSEAFRNYLTTEMPMYSDTGMYTTSDGKFGYSGSGGLGAAYDSWLSTLEPTSAPEPDPIYVAPTDPVAPVDPIYVAPTDPVDPVDPVGPIFVDNPMPDAPEPEDVKYLSGVQPGFDVSEYVDKATAPIAGYQSSQDIRPVQMLYPGDEDQPGMYRGSVYTPTPTYTMPRLNLSGVTTSGTRGAGSTVATTAQNVAAANAAGAMVTSGIGGASSGNVESATTWVGTVTELPAGSFGAGQNEAYSCPSGYVIAMDKGSLYCSRVGSDDSIPERVDINLVKRASGGPVEKSGINSLLDTDLFEASGPGLVSQRKRSYTYPSGTQMTETTAKGRFMFGDR